MKLSLKFCHISKHGFKSNFNVIEAENKINEFVNTWTASSFIGQIRKPDAL